VPEVTDEPARPSGPGMSIEEAARSHATRRAAEPPSDLLREVMDGLNDGIWDWNVETGSVYYNERWATMLGYDPGAGGFTFERWTNLLHPDDATVAHQRISDHFTGLTPLYEAEFRMRTADGDWRWILARGHAVNRDDTGLPTRIVGTHTDITDRKKADAALIQSEARLRQALTAAQLVPWELDDESGALTFDFTALNPFERWQLPVPKTFREYAALMPKLDRGRILENNRALRRLPNDREASFSLEHRIALADGRMAWVHLHGLATRDASGRITHSTGTLADITERKVAGEKLAESQNMLDRVANAAPIVLYLFDLKQRKSLYSNRALYDFLGYTPEDLILVGERFTQDIIHPDDIEGVNRHFTAVMGLPDGVYAENEARMRHRDGKYRSVYGRQMVFQRDEQGVPVVSLGIAMDVTPWREAEAALAEANKSAMSAVNAKSDFVAVVSHELRTPLNAIVGLTDLLIETPLSERQREYVTTVEQAAVQLRQLIDAVLDFSRLDAGAGQTARPATLVASTVFDLRETVRQTAALVEVDAHNKGLALTVRIEPHAPVFARGDESLLRQVLGNLLSNAVKFTASGAVSLSVAPGPAPTAAGTQGAANLVAFTIEDTGIGMAPDQLVHIFEPFWQAETSGRRPHGGAGLGLAIAHRAVERMGGTIQVTSEPGRGSRFIVTLPLATVSTAGILVDTWTPPPHPMGMPATAAAADGREVPAAPAPSQSLRVLVAEDNAVNQLVARRMLERLGYPVQVVSNGMEVIKAVEAGACDVVLLDVNMPVLDGLETAQLLRENFTDEARPWLIAMTADGARGDRDRCLAAGMDDYLAKPVTLPTLSQTLDRVPRRHRSQTPVQH
jgi:PAS domain S-box-containing protein